MEKKTAHNERNGKVTADDYYKVLKLGSNASQEEIEEKYAELIVQYSSDEDPEEFEKVTKIYDILRDPIERQKYDIWRKYEGYLEEVLYKALEYTSQKNWAQAEELFNTVLKKAPHLVEARVGLAQMYLLKEDMEQFNDQVQILLKNGNPEEYWDMVGITGKLLINAGYAEEALDLLNEACHENEECMDMYRVLFIQIYQLLEREEEALPLIEKEVASLEQQELDCIYLYIMWINTVAVLNKWERAHEIQRTMQNFFQAMQEEEEENKQVIADLLMNEYEAYFAEGYLRVAAFYLDLIHDFNPKHPTVQEFRQKLKEWDKVQQEINRMTADSDVFTPVTLKALQLFYEETGVKDVIMEYATQMMPPELIAQFETKTEDYVAGIRYVQQQYPLIYHRYQKQWDQLLEEKAAALSSE